MTTKPITTAQNRRRMGVGVMEEITDFSTREQHQHYNQLRLSSARGYRPPAPEAVLPPVLMSPPPATQKPFMTQD